MKKFRFDCSSPMYSKVTITIMILVLTVVIIACTSALYVPTANQETASVSITDLQAGRKLYIQKCSGCHTLFLPEKYTKDEWHYWINKMEVKVQMDSLDKHRILTYLNKGQ